MSGFVPMWLYELMNVAWAFIAILLFFVARYHYKKVGAKHGR